MVNQFMIVIPHSYKTVKYTILDTSESKMAIHSVTFFENKNLIFPGIQDRILVDLHEELNMQVEYVPMVENSKHMTFLLDMHDKESDQIVVICFESDLGSKTWNKSHQL